MAILGPARRREQILALVGARGSARVADLSAALGAAAVTIRRDVEALAQEGRVTRRYGLVLAAPEAPRPPPLGTVVAVVSFVSGYMQQILLAAQQAVAEAGGRYVLDVAPDAHAVRRSFERAAATEGVEGVLFAPRWQSVAQVTGDLDHVLAPGLPLVLLERFAPRGSLLAARDAVRSDHTSGVHQALSHLRAHGHRRVLLLSRDDSPTARTVRACFAEAQRSLNMPVLSQPLLSSDGADQEHCAQAPDPVAAIARFGATAVLVHSDVDALTMLPRFEAAGLSVPDDLSIVSWDDVVAGMGSVPLTTIAPPKREVGTAAVELLRWRCANPAAPARRLEIATRLVERRSVRSTGR
ncbi:LacI family DNA-binding transcriptional regulator [Kineococcus arenarius]|uniref:LacI family DNA-binding transcriptional regulator n=1 Tax=Kineococcus sp. SYSU DK007 TaxID=3383128 RepID=UPI003D7CBBD1